MTTYTLPDGVQAAATDTARLRVHYLAAGPDGGTPVVFLHGNLASSLFWDETLAALPDGFRGLAVDMRGFGDTEPVPIDATRGMRDFSDDLHAFIEAMELSTPVHLVGWSTGGGAIMQYAIDHADSVASLTLVDTVSPHGFVGTKDVKGTPCYPDYAGAGAGGLAPEMIERLQSGDTSTDSDLSPRSVMRNFYVSPNHTFDPAREDALVEAILKTTTGSGGFPGDVAPSDNWPTFAPGPGGVNNALAGGNCDLSALVDIDPKPPILWIRGADDQVVSDNSMFDTGQLGLLGVIPGWPGEDVYPPQPMVQQITAMLETYVHNGGSSNEVVIADSGHSPHLDQAGVFQERLNTFLVELGEPAWG